MKNTLLIFFAIISFSGLSQSPIWTKGNAVWHYRFTNVGESGYIKVWENGDTTLLGKQCTKMRSERHSFSLVGPNGPYFESTSGYISTSVYVSNDTVFYWDQDHFSVLYDFSAQVGDEWLLQTGGNPPFSCNDTSVAIVESVGTINLGGQNYPELTVGSSPGSGYYISGKANARFGSLGYLFPFPASCDSSVIVEWDQVQFACFEDDSLYYNPSGQGCEIHLGLNEAVKKSVAVFPNPSQGKVEVLSEVPLKRINVLNILGTLIKEVNTDLTLTEVDLSGLPQGTYYLDIENRNGEKAVKSVQVSGR